MLNSQEKYTQAMDNLRKKQESWKVRKCDLQRKAVVSTLDCSAVETSGVVH